MSKKNGSADPFRRTKTRHRGISYRERADGSRRYSIYFRGNYIAVEGGEQEAIAKQADLRGRAARGERAVVPKKQTFAEVAELWFYRSAICSLGHERRIGRRSTTKIPRLGTMKVTAVNVDHVAALIHELERRSLSSATINNYVKPLNGTITFSVRRGVIAVNPCSLLTRDDRPRVANVSKITSGTTTRSRR
jgi:hypothetical protein